MDAFSRPRHPRVVSPPSPASPPVMLRRIQGRVRHARPRPLSSRVGIHARIRGAVAPPAAACHLPLVHVHSYSAMFADGWAGTDIDRPGALCASVVHARRWPTVSSSGRRRRRVAVRACDDGDGDAGRDPENPTCHPMLRRRKDWKVALRRPRPARRCELGDRGSSRGRRSFRAGRLAAAGMTPTSIDGCERSS